MTKDQIQRIQEGVLTRIADEKYARDGVLPSDGNFNIMQFFTFSHLPTPLQEISRPFSELAVSLNAVLPNNPEKTSALRKLLEAKDCAVRARLFINSGI